MSHHVNTNVEVDTETCAYCGAEVAKREGVPSLSDDETWADLATEHAPTCEWVATRAHRRDAPPTVEQHIAAQAKESAAELIRQGWAAPGSMYDVAVRYGRDCSDIEALERRSGLPATPSAARYLEAAIRERLDRDRPVRASRAL